jgi:hypothetical protein
MPRTVFFYNNVGPTNNRTTTSPGQPRNFSVSKSRDGVELTGGDVRSIHINAQLIGSAPGGIEVSEIYVDQRRPRIRRMVWGGGFIRNKRVLWDGKGIQTSSERLDRLVRQHINY